jgi:hypothetical protein
LERFRSRNKTDVINKLKSFVSAVDRGLYKNAKSYRMDEVDRNDSGNFSALEKDLK